MVFKKGESHIPWNKGLTKEIDSRISTPWLGKKRPNISNNMKGNKNPFFGKKHSEEDIIKMKHKRNKRPIKDKLINRCIICNKDTHNKTCSKECMKKLLSKVARDNKLGGHFSKRNTYFKNIKNEMFCLNSSYEVIFAESMNLKNVYWIRPKPLIWLDKNKIEHLYYPDFYVPKTNIYYDTKNDYLIKKDKDKIKRVQIQNNIKLIVIDKYHLQYRGH
jgi:hypothetical protein